MVAEAAHRALFCRDDNVVRLGELPNHVLIQRLHEAPVSDRYTHVCGLLLDQLCRAHCLLQPCAYRQERHFDFHVRLCPPHDAPLANLDSRDIRRTRDLIERVPKQRVQALHAKAVAARITHAGGLVINGPGSLDHAHQLDLIRGRHNDYVGKCAQIGQIVAAVMRGAVIANETGAINHEAHWQTLNDDVVHKLIIPALQEGRVDGAEGLEPLHCHARRESNGMLLGDAHIKRAFREKTPEVVEACSSRHCCRDSHDRWVLTRELTQGVGKIRCVCGLAGRALFLLSGRNIKLRYTMHAI
mmetsp:Transcript_57071/g.48165  ORF Transcript_57071/g.48165 Transcript_57071/m.48165 type:complete len:300 (-) Transcript_57071:1156-2055(-)